VSGTCGLSRVAVLAAPERDGDGWTSKPNTTPIRDISALVPKLRFASGKGVTAQPGKLGMSLQTPRELAAGDITLLEAPGSAGEAYAQVLARRRR
jgi:hypothetical protein